LQNYFFRQGALPLNALDEWKVDVSLCLPFKETAMGIGFYDFSRL